MPIKGTLEYEDLWYDRSEAERLFYTVIFEV